MAPEWSSECSELGLKLRLELVFLVLAYSIYMILGLVNIGQPGAVLCLEGIVRVLGPKFQTGVMHQLQQSSTSGTQI